MILFSYPSSILITRDYCSMSDPQELSGHNFECCTQKINTLQQTVALLLHTMCQDITHAV